MPLAQLLSDNNQARNPGLERRGGTGWVIISSGQAYTIVFTGKKVWAEPGEKVEAKKSKQK